VPVEQTFESLSYLFSPFIAWFPVAASVSSLLLIIILYTFQNLSTAALRKFEERPGQIQNSKGDKTILVLNAIGSTPGFFMHS
jgi:hypothetical protein